MPLDPAPHWGVSLEQTLVLLKHRCYSVRFDGALEDEQLRTGSVESLLPIIRYLFINFSEVLCDFLEDHGHIFEPGMDDKDLAARVIACWHLISPQPQLGGITVQKLLTRGRWGVDRLLFTMQCLLVCVNKHNELQARRNAEARSFQPLGISSSFAVSAAHRPFGSGDVRETLQSTTQWMVGVYREQLESLEQAAELDGQSEQARWVAAFDSTAVGPRLEQGGGTVGGHPALDAEQQQAYHDQLRRVGLNTASSAPMAAASARMAERYEAKMRALCMGEEMLDDDDIDDFDDSLNTPFIES